MLYPELGLLMAIERLTPGWRQYSNDLSFVWVGRTPVWRELCAQHPEHTCDLPREIYYHNNSAPAFRSAVVPTLTASSRMARKGLV